MLRTQTLSVLCGLFLAVAACGGKQDTSGGPPPTFPDHAKPKVGDKTGPSPEQILADSDLPKPLASPLQSDPMGATVHRLSNGMTVYISHNDAKPRFSAWIAVRTGSKNDPADSTGLAHYLEHMLFKGTDELGTTNFEAEKPHLDKIADLYDQLRATDDAARRKQIFAEIDDETQKTAEYAVPNELDQLYASLGVSGLNAFTSDEETVYVADVPSNRFEAWARVEAERFADAQFRLFYPELEAVYEEKNRTLDNPDQRVSETMLKALYPDHPYGTQTTIGEIEHLKTPAYGDMVAFFHRWYQPNNMAIVLAGDVTAEEAIPVLERQFSRMKPKELPAAREKAPSPIHGRVEREVKAKGENRVYLAWRTVDFNDPDRPALEVMDWLTNNAKSGLVDIDLVLSQKLPRAGSYPQNYYEGGHWVLWGAAREGQSHEEVEKLLRGVVAKLKAGEFTQEDIDAVVVNEEIREKRSLESNQARVARMTESFIEHTPWKVESQRLAKLRKVTRDDVIRVANKYLGGDVVVVKRIKGEFDPPKITKPHITPIKIDTEKESDFASSIEHLQAKPIEPHWLVEGKDYTRGELPAGELIAVKNDRNDLFSVSYRFELGEKREKLLCYALDLLDRSGAENMSPAALQKKLYSIGTDINTSCGADETTISVSGIDRHMEESLALLDKWLRTAAFSPETVKKLAANVLSQRKDRMEEPRFVSSALSSYVLHGKESPYLLEPSNRAIKRARPKQLKRLLATLPDHQHRTSYFGPRSADEAAKVVGLGKHHRKVRRRDPVRYRTVKKPTIFFLDKKVTQSQIRLAYPHQPIDNGDRLLSRFYTEYVGGGMGSLVFQEIREARGLAYSAWAYHAANDRPKDQSALIAGIGTQADKTRDALGAILGLLKKIDVEDARFTTARAALEQKFRAGRIDPRDEADYLISWEEMGYKKDPRPMRFEKLQKLDEKALETFSSSLSEAAPVIAIMGDGSRIDLDALKKQIGPIVKLKIGQLVSY